VLIMIYLRNPVLQYYDDDPPARYIDVMWALRRTIDKVGRPLINASLICCVKLLMYTLSLQV